MLRLRRPSRSTLIPLAGLFVGVVGLVVQWIAVPSKFNEPVPPFGIAFPPGMAFVVGAGLLMLLTARWWWHPVFGVLISFWIVAVGAMAGKLTPNLTSHNPGTVAGNAVMSLGLTLTFCAGIHSMVMARRTRRIAAAEPDLVHQR